MWHLGDLILLKVDRSTQSSLQAAQKDKSHKIVAPHKQALALYCSQKKWNPSLDVKLKTTERFYCSPSVLSDRRRQCRMKAAKLYGYSARALLFLRVLCFSPVWLGHPSPPSAHSCILFFLLFSWTFLEKKKKEGRKNIFSRYVFSASNLDISVSLTSLLFLWSDKGVSPPGIRDIPKWTSVPCQLLASENWRDCHIHIVDLLGRVKQHHSWLARSLQHLSHTVSDVIRC